MTKKCPDFDLAPLEAFDPRIFDPRDDYEKRLKPFVLALALIFNDFKSIDWWNWQLQKGAPEDTHKISAYHGQYNAMRIQIVRLNLGIFHELLKLIEDHLDVINDKRFKIYLGRLGPPATKRWKSLINYASNWRSKRKDNSTFSGFSQRLRSNIAFHYAPKALAKGLDNFVKSGTAHSKTLYASLGENPESSRFYFADAAVDQSARDTFEDFGQEQKKVRKYRKLMNEPVRFVVEAFLRIEQEKLDSDLGKDGV